MQGTPNRRILSLAAALFALFLIVHITAPFAPGLAFVHAGAALIAVASCVGWAWTLGSDASSVIALFGIGMAARAGLAWWAITKAGLAGERNLVVMFVVAYLFAEIAVLAVGSKGELIAGEVRS